MALDWNEANLERIRDSRIPKGPGVYVIKQVKRIMGLPVRHEIIYVGKTNSLQRRFKEHCSPRSEHNIELLHASWSKKLEFWFAEVSKDELDGVERDLIRRLEPETNIVRYRRR